MTTPNSATQQDMDAQVIANSAKHGDQVDQPRPIEHYAYFPSQLSMSRFVDWAKSAGFQVTDASRRKSGEWAVLFQKTAPLTIEAVSEQSSAATQAAEKIGGKYDGWETAIVRKKK